jgi:hypothetical protein
MPRRERKIWRPRAAKRAEEAAEATRKKYRGPAPDDESAARTKRKAKGLLRLPRRLTAIS